jgi:hypothetical protein
VRVPVSATEFIAPRPVRRYRLDAWEASPPVPGRGRSSAARPLYELRGDRSSGSRMNPVPTGPRSA